MGDDTNPDASAEWMAGDPDDWAGFVDEMNESFLATVERNVEAQSRFVDSWLDALEESTGSTEEATEGLEAYGRAYRHWISAAEEQFEQATAAVEGEEVAVEEFRDVWLSTANDFFKELMSTTAFAAATGETVENALAFRRQVDEAAEEALHELGFATRGDVTEVGERLLELERRQHAIETKLDEVLAAVDEDADGEAGP
jgi:polyhydroxyalkanoate synthesis regulator phasin